MSEGVCVWQTPQVLKIGQIYVGQGNGRPCGWLTKCRI